MNMKVLGKFGKSYLVGIASDMGFLIGNGKVSEMDHVREFTANFVFEPVLDDGEIQRVLDACNDLDGYLANWKEGCDLI